MCSNLENILKRDIFENPLQIHGINQNQRRLFCMKILAIIFIVIFVAMPCLKYIALHSYYFDLGIFQTVLYKIAYQNEWGAIFHGHAHLVALPYILVMKWIPQQYDAQFLLLTQSVTLMLPVWFLYRRFGLFVAAVFVLYAPLWINNHFEFHFDHLSVPFLLWFFLAASSNRPLTATIAALLLMTIKEPFALQTAACGVFLLWRGYNLSNIEIVSKRPQYVWLGVLLVVAGLFYFYFVTAYLIPYFTDGVPGALAAKAFEWLGGSLGQMVKYIIMHPFAIILDVISTPEKILFLFVVFGTLAFIPFFAPSYLIPSLPLLAIAMLSRDPIYYNCHKHYTAGIIMPAIFAFAYGLPSARLSWIKMLNYIIQLKMVNSLLSNKLRKNVLNLFYGFIMLSVVGGHIFLAPSPFSWWFWSDRLWAYNWRAYHVTERDKMIRQAIFDLIPSNPSVPVVTQTSINLTYLAQRNMYESFPSGIETPIIVTDWSKRTIKSFLYFLKTGIMPITVKKNQYSDYVILDLKRPWFVGDSSCRWQYGTCQDKQVASEFLDWIAKAKKYYHIIFETDGFMILKRA